MGRGTASSYSWLAELQEFRGRVLWQDGRRPAFRRHDGRFSDPDEHDLSAYHLILREQGTGAIVGSSRHAPLELLVRSHLEDLDEAVVPRILTAYRCNAWDVLEGGRLIIDPAWRGHGLGSHLVAAGSALARVVGRRLLWGVAGTHDRQERVFLHLGHRRFSDTLVTVPQYDDEVSIIVCQPANIPDDAAATVAALEVQLRRFRVEPAGSNTRPQSSGVAPSMPAVDLLM